MQDIEQPQTNMIRIIKPTNTDITAKEKQNLKSLYATEHQHQFIPPIKNYRQKWYRTGENERVMHAYTSIYVIILHSNKTIQHTTLCNMISTAIYKRFMYKNFKWKKKKKLTNKQKNKTPKFLQTRQKSNSSVIQS